MFKTIEWKNNRVLLIDQTKLPSEEVYVTISTWQEMATAIKTMIVRGAPAIGVAASMGVALGVLGSMARDFLSLQTEVNHICGELFKTRPTAVNLAWGLDRMQKCLQKNREEPFAKLGQILVMEAQNICAEDILLNKQMGEHGQKYLADGDRVLTHCNAGALATAGHGTALGVIYAAAAHGKKISVLADETRPFLQGSRLTVWELGQNNIPTTLITDNMAGWMMKKGEIDKVIVGADRIAANGDVANKIGTYAVAILAKEHGIPFYVAAPLSTIDLKTRSGDDIPIEERAAIEVTHVKGQPLAPKDTKVRNPAFDVTPNQYVTAIITEKGIAKSPYQQSLKKLFDEVRRGDVVCPNG